MPGQYSDVLQMFLMPEMPILGIIWNLLDPENQNIEFLKFIFQAPLKCHTKTVRKIEAFVQKLQLFFNCKNRLHFTISRVFKDILYVLNNFLCSFSSFCDEFVCFTRF